MRRVGLIVALLPWIFCFGQFTDDFSDADAAHETWMGDWEHFAITKDGRLKTQVAVAAESALYHESTAAIDAEWSGWTKVQGGVSAKNLVRFYLTMDDESEDAYFVQIGGANKNVVLYEQDRDDVTKVIENQDRKKILSASTVVVNWRVTRGRDGVFHLYSQVDGVDSVMVEEGAYPANLVRSTYFAIEVKNSSKRGYDFYIDDIVVTGVAQTESIHQTDGSEPVQTDSTKASVRLLTESISPNGDGYEDEACLAFSLPNEDYKTSLSVYTPSGALVKTICQKQETPAGGTLCWDGTNAKGVTVGIGVYVLAVEMKNSKTKDVFRKRYAVAVLR